VRWRRLFGLAPSRPGHPFGVQHLLAALLAYALTLGLLGAVASEMGFADPWGTAVGLFVVFALILLARFALERRAQSGVRRR
jgi:hypothetical protein